jgi:hypothetical protein
MKVVRFLLDYIDPSLKERTGEAIHNRYNECTSPDGNGILVGWGSAHKIQWTAGNSS